MRLGFFPLLVPGGKVCIAAAVVCLHQQGKDDTFAFQVRGCLREVISQFLCREKGGWCRSGALPATDCSPSSPESSELFSHSQAPLIGRCLGQGSPYFLSNVHYSHWEALKRNPGTHSPSSQIMANLLLHKTSYKGVTQGP